MRLIRYRYLRIVFVIIGVLFNLSSSVSAQAMGTRVGFSKNYDLPLETLFEIPVEIQSVTDLYAIDLEITFDPDILTFEDADPNASGIQPALGTFLDAGLVVYNIVDLDKGIIQFAMTQINPSEPKSGSGVLLVLYPKGIKEGECELKVTSLALSTREGNVIDAEPANATISVSSNTLPITVTSIPVQDSTKMILIPTLAPTATPTLVPTHTPMPALTNTQVLKSTEMTKNDNNLATEAEESEKDKFSLQDNWWILLIVFVLIAGLILYLVISKKNNNHLEV